MGDNRNQNYQKPHFDDASRIGSNSMNPPNYQDSQLARQGYAHPPELMPEQEEALVRYNHLTYLLYALSFFTAGLLWIVPIIMNYARRNKAEGTWLATHFDWQIKTFWYGIVFGVIGIAIIVAGAGGLGMGVFAESSGMAVGSTGLMLLGALVFGFAVVWHIYRIIRGWIALTDKRPVP